MGVGGRKEVGKNGQNEMLIFLLPCLFIANILIPVKIPTVEEILNPVPTI